MVENLQHSDLTKLLKDKFSHYIKDIILPTNADSEVVNMAESLLKNFNDNEPEKFFLLSLINFLSCAIIIYYRNNFQSHSQRRKWINNLNEEEKKFFENNRLRINKFFPLLWAIDNLPVNLRGDIEKFWQILGNENYNKLSDEEKMQVLNDFKEYCLEIFNRLKLINNSRTNEN